MDKFQKWFADSPIASFLRHFAAIVIASAVADFALAGAFDFSRWEQWFIAALVAAVPPFLRWLNPQDALSSAKG